MSNQERDTKLHEMLCAFALGEATEEERFEVEAALERSPELRAELEEIQKTIGLVQVSFPEPELSPAIRETLQKASETLPIKEIPRGRMRRVVQVTVALAAGLVVVFGAYVFSKVGDVMVETSSTARRTMDELGYVDSEAKEDSGDQAMLKALGYAGEERAKDPSGSTKLRSLGYVGDDRDSNLGLAASAPEAASSELRSEENNLSDARGGSRLDALRQLAYGGEDPVEEPVLGESLAGGDSFKGPGDTVPPGRAAELTAEQERELEAMGYGGYAPSEPLLKDSSPGPSNEDLRSLGYAGGEGPSSKPEASKEQVVAVGGGAGGKFGGRFGGDKRTRLEGNERRESTGSDAWFLGRPERRSLADEEASGFVILDGRYGQDPADVEELIRGCRRRPRESARDMFFRFWGEHPFQPTRFSPVSTFAADVDTASYVLTRRYLSSGQLPPAASVRTEEFLNYFKPDVAPPSASVGHPFALQLEMAPSYFGEDENTWMLRVTARGAERDRYERDPLALTFVVDTSGSMKTGNRLELVKKSLRLLMAELGPEDTLALVSFSNTAQVRFPMNSVAQRGRFGEILAQLTPSGGTNAEAGLWEGFREAALHVKPGVVSRVVFLSDGVGNIGETDQNRILDQVAEYRSRGIYLNTIGVGMGNHNDTFLEQLANRGDGLCNYFDTEREARRALVENFTGAFQPIARDVKIQVEFDPAQVESFRQLGYENRAVANADFRNDAVDAGEINAGHQVTALYELKLSAAAAERGPLATARLRYKSPFEAGQGERNEETKELTSSLSAQELAPNFASTTPGYRRAVLVAQFAECLRLSIHAQGDSYEALMRAAEALGQVLVDPDFEEFESLLRQAQPGLAKLSSNERTELDRHVEQLRRLHYYQARLEQLRANHVPEPGTTEESEEEGFLEEIRELEEKIRGLVNDRARNQERLRALGY